MTTTLVSIVVLGLLLVVGGALYRRGVRTAVQPHVPYTGGVLVMRPPRRLGILLGISALIPAGVLAAVASRAFIGGRTGPGGLAAIVLATLVALAFAVHQLATGFRQRWVVDDVGVERVGVLTRRRVAWRTIVRVAYNPASRWFFVTASDGSHLWLSVDLNGIADFATLALSRVPAGALKDDEFAREALEELAASTR